MFCDLHCNLTPFQHLDAIEAWRLAGMLAMEPGESFTFADLIAAGGRSVGHIVLSAPTLLVSRHGAQLPRSEWHSLNWTAPLEQFYRDGYSFWGDVFLSLTGAQGQPLTGKKWQVIPTDEANLCREINRSIEANCRSNRILTKPNRYRKVVSNPLLQGQCNGNASNCHSSGWPYSKQRCIRRLAGPVPE